MLAAGWKRVPFFHSQTVCFSTVLLQLDMCPFASHPPRTLHRAPPMSAAPVAAAQSPGPKPRPAAAAVAQPSPDAIGRRSPYAPLRPSPEAAKVLKTPQLSFVSDDSAMEVPLSRRSAGGGSSASPLVQPQVCDTCASLITAQEVTISTADGSWDCAAPTQAACGKLGHLGTCSLCNPALCKHSHRLWGEHALVNWGAIAILRQAFDKC